MNGTVSVGERQSEPTSGGRSVRVPCVEHHLGAAAGKRFGASMRGRDSSVSEIAYLVCEIGGYL